MRSILIPKLVSRYRKKLVIKTSLTTMGVIGNNLLGRYKVYFDIKNWLIDLS